MRHRQNPAVHRSKVACNRGRGGRRLGVLAALAFVATSVAAAQEVTLTTPGIVSITGVPPIYNGKYFLQKTDFGFFWLDTTTLRAGLVEVLSKCTTGFPPSSTGIYIRGDCWGISNLSSSGNVVLARAFISCPGFPSCDSQERLQANGMHQFTLGTWEYQGITETDIPDSTQTTDPQGRTWAVTPNSLYSFTFKVTGGNTNVSPTAFANATNLSAANRSDKTNYYGDKWLLQDASESIGQITRVDWDFNYKSSFSPDEIGTPPGESSVIGYFPCDPSGPTAGNFRTGAGCVQSLGLTNPAAAGSYRFAMQSANSNGTSTSPFVAAGESVVCPEAMIGSYAGYTGTCAKTNGTLNILVGGTADASASRGNTSEASFTWTFTGSNPATLSGPSVTVPAGDTGFTLTITYPGGYKATAQGSVSQVSFVPGFSVAPDPVLEGSQLTLTNQMQKTGSVTVNSVNSVVSPGVCDPSFNSFSSALTLPASFLAVGGIAALQAPATSGPYCSYLKFNYTPLSQPQQSQIAWKPFTVTSWTPNPQISISPVPFCFSSCALEIGTSYTLVDAEAIPVTPHPAAQWDLVSTTSSPVAYSSDASTPVAWTPTASCTGCLLRLTVNGVSVSLPVSVSGPSQPLSIAAQGPSTGAVGASLAFSAVARGGNMPYGYSWSCDSSAVNPVFTPSGSSFVCTYSTSGTRTVQVKVTDATSGAASSTPISVSVSAAACGVFTDIADASLCPFVLAIANAGITTGCTPTTFCPDDNVFRLQMAVFLARAQAGGDANVPSTGTAMGQPYNCSAGGISLFSDVAASSAFCRHVHYIYATGVTTGTEPGRFSPNPLVSRAQMGMFIARAIAGSDAAVPQTYGPDLVTGRSYSCSAGSPNLHFTDVITSDIFCRHAHYLWARDVNIGVQENTYQPTLNVTRGVMAKFLATSFKLSI